MGNSPKSKFAPARRFAFLTLTALALFPALLPAQRPATIPLPPMGWSSWNSFSNTINSDITIAQAKAMVSTGMAKAGYRYINIDEGWWLGDRDAEGNIVVDPKAWPALASGEKPGDMANIVRFIHAQGLKAGTYTDAGQDGCGTVGPDLGPGYPNEGAENHYEQDFLQFARWGFDYVKVDWCGGDKENLDPAVQYAEIARAIARAQSITGHRLYYSICNWGARSPWTWAPGVGGVTADIWRTGGDIVAPIVAGTKNASRRAELKEVFREFDQGNHPEAQHTGYYNDLDMMVAGMSGLSDAENRVHMSLWAISASPLLIGADLTELTPATLSLLTNPDVLAINQDPLGLQAVKVAEPAPGLQVWSKPLAKSGDRAVLLLNRTAAAASITARFSDLNLTAAVPVTIKDLWPDKSLGSFPASYSATVEPGDAALLLIHGAEAKFTTYKPAPSPNQLATFTQVAAAHSMARVQVVYANPAKTTRLAELRVNGRIATRIAFPPTGPTPAFVTIQSQLDRPGATNVLEFSPAAGPPPQIQSISVQ